MFATILAVSLGYAAAAVAVAAVIGGVLGYGFRGKEQKALSNLGSDIKKKL